MIDRPPIIPEDEPPEDFPPAPQDQVSEEFVDDLKGPLYYETAAEKPPEEDDKDKFVYKYPIPGQELFE